jgi:hypothetical protein
VVEKLSKLFGEGRDVDASRARKAAGTGTQLRDQADSAIL